jgi:putative endonuclease
MFFTYVLRSEATGRYYIGSTKDVSQRLVQHNSGTTPSTRRNRPWKLAHVEGFAILSEARRRERQLKGWKNPGYMGRILGLDTAHGAERPD